MSTDYWDEGSTEFTFCVCAILAWLVLSMFYSARTFSDLRRHAPKNEHMHVLVWFAGEGNTLSQCQHRKSVPPR